LLGVVPTISRHAREVRECLSWTMVGIGLLLSLFAMLASDDLWLGPFRSDCQLRIYCWKGRALGKAAIYSGIATARVTNWYLAGGPCHNASRVKTVHASDVSVGHNTRAKVDCPLVAYWHFAMNPFDVAVVG